MDRVSVVIKSYVCPSCLYTQDVDPRTPGTQASMFPEFPGIQDGQCPACYSGRTDKGVRETQAMESVDGIDLSPVRMNVASDADLEAQYEYEVDHLGRTVMVDSGEIVEELAIIDGKAQVIEKPVMVEKKRDLTDIELSDLKTKRQATLDKLDAIAVKELTDTPLEPSDLEVRQPQEADPTEG